MRNKLILPMIDIAAGFAPASISLKLHFFDDAQTNVTTDTGLTSEMKTYYSKRLIDLAEPELIHDRFGASYPIPAGSGTTMEMRYWNPLAKALTPLTEGITPAGLKMTMGVLTVSLQQFGAYVPYSDILAKATIDPFAERATMELGSQAGRTLDTITREVLNGGTNVMYAPQVVSGVETEILLRSNVNTNCLFTPKVTRQAVNLLKRVNAKKQGGSYAVIAHPDTITDLMGTDEWTQAQKYVNPEKIYSGSPGKMYDAAFNETSEAKIIGPEPIFGTNEVNPVPRLTLHTALDGTGSVNILIAEGITAAQAADLTAKIAAATAAGTTIKIYVGGKEATVASVTAGAAGTGKIVVTTAVTNVAAGAMVCGYGAGKDGSAVYSTLFIAANAYGRTELEGLGLQHIVKPLGYADPLNQVGTIGWKATKAAKRLVEIYMLRVEHSTSLGLTAVSN